MNIKVKKQNAKNYIERTKHRNKILRSLFDLFAFTHFFSQKQKTNFLIMMQRSTFKVLSELSCLVGNPLPLYLLIPVSSSILLRLLVTPCSSCLPYLVDTVRDITFIYPSGYS